MAKEVLTRKMDDLGRITIPKAICKELGISSGDVLEMSVANNSVCIRKRDFLKVYSNSFRDFKIYLDDKDINVEDKKELVKKVDEVIALMESNKI